MIRLTIEKRFRIVESGIRDVHRALRMFYDQQIRPSEQTILAVVFALTLFTLLDSKTSTRQRNVSTEKNIASFSE